MLLSRACLWSYTLGARRFHFQHWMRTGSQFLMAAFTRTGTHTCPCSNSMPVELQQAKFVFVRRDTHRTSLQRPYEGPFKVIESDRQVRDHYSRQAKDGLPGHRQSSSGCTTTPMGTIPHPSSTN